MTRLRCAAPYAAAMLSHLTNVHFNCEVADCEDEFLVITRDLTLDEAKRVTGFLTDMALLHSYAAPLQLTRFVSRLMKEVMPHART